MDLTSKFMVFKDRLMTLKAWVGYDELLSKWVSEDEERIFVTFDQFVDFASKNPKLDLPVDGTGVARAGQGTRL